MSSPGLTPGRRMPSPSWPASRLASFVNATQSRARRGSGSSPNGSSEHAPAAATAAARMARPALRLIPAEADLAGLRLEGARRQGGRRGGHVELARSDVVRRGPVEERGQVLDLPAAGAELELAAAVDRDPVLLAVFVGVEEVLERAEPRGLEVEGPRRELEPLDVGDRMDGRVPGDAVVVRLENRPRLVSEGRILEPSIRERDRDASVEERIRGLVDRSAFVGALEVERVDCAESDELRDDLLRPRARRVELEADARVSLDEAQHRIERRWVAEAERDDVADRLRRAPHGSGERLTRLTKRKIERSAL